MPVSQRARTGVVCAAALVTLAVTAAVQPPDDAPPPVPARNDVSRTLGPEAEVLMLRHQYLARGTHEMYYRASAYGVWPWFEQIGARIVGQWQVIHPEGAASRTEPSPDHDEMITMARYAGYDHYVGLQPGRAVLMGGNGPDWRAWREAAEAIELATLDTRVEFLEGYFYDSPPSYMPPLPERYRLSGGAAR